ncbi:hypothetical protein F511_34346 [Dorcoceras hygrometricum]|uniref:Uncharacterized protein n=1 Tax=Dorcoceras hygrometricum TaxID=472368 RepID=A0A2Z7AFT9_9LAMI|nr:hypothetical protein F511_34346 [Dorcoceras hygrometricum]
MMKWQHRGVRDPEVKSGEPHRHIEHAGPLDSLDLNDAGDDPADFMPIGVGIRAVVLVGYQSSAWSSEVALPAIYVKVLGASIPPRRAGDQQDDDAPPPPPPPQLKPYERTSVDMLAGITRMLERVFQACYLAGTCAWLQPVFQEPGASRLIAVVTSIRSTTRFETPSSDCTRSPDEISTIGFSTKN